MHAQQVKTVGHNGQLYLGKDFADKMVLIDRFNEHTLVIKTGEFKAHAEAWLSSAEIKKIDEAVKWRANNPPRDNAVEILSILEANAHASR